MECAESVQGAKELARHSGVRRYVEVLIEMEDRPEGAEHSTVSYEDVVWTTEPVAG